MYAKHCFESNDSQSTKTAGHFSSKCLSENDVINDADEQSEAKTVLNLNVGVLRNSK